MQKKISFSLALIMILSAVFGGGLQSTIFAADPVDSFDWAFWDDQPTPIVENIAEETQNVTGTGTAFTKLIGEYPTSAFAGITDGTSDFNSAEAKPNILDGSTGSKWLSNVQANTWWVSFAMKEASNPGGYYISSANDAIDRDPSAWTLLGRAVEGEGDWIEIDTRANQAFPNRFQTNYYEIAAEKRGLFSEFRLNITARQGGGGGQQMMQMSRIGFAEGQETIGFTGTTDYLYPQLSGQPSAMRDGAASPWNGPNVLTVNGTTANPGTGSTVDAKSYTRILKGLNIAVYPDTQFSYVIDPVSIGSYDYKLTSAHMALDLKFTDGTRLKDLGAKDIYGFAMTPLGQGQAKVYHEGTWNYVESPIGKIAAGKVIEEIIVGFEMPDAPKNIGAQASFDDIKIFRRDDAAVIPATELADFTDIRQGTRVGDYGNGAMSAIVATPNAFNYWVPSTTTNASSPYHSGNRELKFIRISHLASRWMGERGTLTFMSDAATPIPTGDNNAQNAAVNGAVSNSNGRFEKTNEFAAHYYHYGVKFNEDDEKNPGVSIEVTPTEHAAVLRFIFPAGSAARNILIGGASSAATMDGNAFRTTSAGGNGMRNMYTYGEFSAAPVYFKAGGNANSMASFPDLANGLNGETIIEMKVATSFMGVAQAARNLNLEIAGNDDFDAVCAKAKDIWNKTLGIVQIEDADADYWDFVDFYSKFARSNLYPTILHENTADGSVDDANENPRWQYVSPYRGSNNAPAIRDGYFSYNEGFWDTYRTKWPALGFFRPAAAGYLFDGIVNHFIDQDTRGSFAIPRWINPGGSDLMVMTSSDVIATELYARGVDYNYIAGYDAALKSSTVYGPTSGTEGGRYGIQTSIFKGYTPWGSAKAAGGGGQLDTSWALEGFLNDAGTAKMAQSLGEEAKAEGDDELARQYNDEYLYFTNRAKYYTNHFNATNLGSVGSAGWMMNKDGQGRWLGGNGSLTTPFNALDWGWGFCEDNAYQYTITVPQDGRGLANLYGGKEAFGDKLEHIFTYWDGAQLRGGGYGGTIHEALEKREIKIGQWGLSNQPGYHMPYMWLFSDRPEETAKYVRMGIDQVFGSGQVGRGYQGEEDNGSQSSWYVWAALGLFPLDLGSGQLVVGSPKFKHVTIATDDGREFELNAPNAGDGKIYVNGITLNGEAHDQLYFDQSDFADGAVVEFDMGEEPTDWIKTADAPPSLTETGDGAEFEPDILMDIIPEGLTPADAIDPAANTNQVAVIGAEADNARFLFDNFSTTTETRFDGSSAVITYYSATPVKVELYTLTSSDTAGADPKVWRLSGSKDGNNWEVIDLRSLDNITTYVNSPISTGADAATKDSETFRWRRQTKPFAIDEDKQDAYSYYRLDIGQRSSEEPLRLAEFELLADQYYEIDKTALKAAIDRVAEIKAAQEESPVYGETEYLDLLAELPLAQAVYDDPAALGREVNAALNHLNAAINALIPIKKAYIPFDAADFSYTYNAPGAVDTLGTEMTNPAAGSVVPPTPAVEVTKGSTPGAVLGYKYIDFGSGDRVYTNARATYAGPNSDCQGAHMIVHLDSPDGPVIADISTPPTGDSWANYRHGYGEILLSNITGVHDVYIELQSEGRHVANIYQFVFETEEETIPADGWIVSPIVTEDEDTIVIDAIVRNNTDEDGAISLYAAVYASDEKLVSVEAVTVDDVPSKTSVWAATIEIDTSAAGEGYTIKLFGWAPDFKPLVEAIQIK